MKKKIESALVSVFHKEGLEPMVDMLKQNKVQVYSTGGTQKYLEEMGLDVTAVETLTGYPSIFGGRVKTLHPAVFGGILHRRNHEEDENDQEEHGIPSIDLVVVDLYPFESTVAAGASHEDIIEKIDIGGISLIRAAAKNYQDVAVVSNRDQYAQLAEWLQDGQGSLNEEHRKALAARAFAVSSYYDTQIFNYLNKDNLEGAYRMSVDGAQILRYGENPHQKGCFYGDLGELFEQVQGKKLSYNNLVDVEACLSGMRDVQSLDALQEPNCIIIKHTNACGWAYGSTLLEAYERALAGDPVSAFGGVIGMNQKLDVATAEKLNELFFEILIAPAYEPEALEILQSKKNRIILELNQLPEETETSRILLNGVLVQDIDQVVDKEEDMELVTKQGLNSQQKKDLLFASMISKNSKSNTIVLVKGGQLIGSGVGQTSRVDAARQAIEKAQRFDFDTKGAALASDAFFPFPDVVEIGAEAGIAAVLQPGGSIRDQQSIDKANEKGLAMVFTGRRHFKH